MQVWETVNIPMGIYMLNFKTSYFKKSWLVIEVPYIIGILKTQSVIWHIQFCWRREQAFIIWTSNLVIRGNNIAYQTFVLSYKWYLQKIYCCPIRKPQMVFDDSEESLIYRKSLQDKQYRWNFIFSRIQCTYYQII